MIVNNTNTQSASNDEVHTIWGLEPWHLHDRLWAARGVQVVRQGRPSDIVDDAELFLLTGPNVLTMFKMRQLVETLCWIKPVLLYIRIADEREQGYREYAEVDQNDRFIQFRRIYGANESYAMRVAFTAHREIALAWQTAVSTSAGWRLLRQSIQSNQRTAVTIKGNVFDGDDPQDTLLFMRSAVARWKKPDATIEGVQYVGQQTWSATDSQIEPGTRFVGPVWVGAGRQLSAATPVVGPTVLWDDPLARPTISTLQWDEIEPAEHLAGPIHPKRRTKLDARFKRLFDICFALIVLLLTSPIYPVIMLAIWIEDGRPWFFGHQRETIGGKEFPCLKFRSMRKDAESLKAELAESNRADGPQFFIENDPRLTRVGRLIRRMNLDELPQFINVLMGHMSVVGPRPSPFNENQYCPGWREARLSIRPGITGLWQVKRSRLEGMDFQEWIKYDIEYVENFGWRMDLWIILKTIPIVFEGIMR